MYVIDDDGESVRLFTHFQNISILRNQMVIEMSEKFRGFANKIYPFSQIANMMHCGLVSEQDQ